MHNITINKRSYTIPSSWAEITHPQMVGVAPLLFGNEQTLWIRKGLVLKILLPEIQKYFDSLTYEQKWDLLNLSNWLFDDITGRSIVRSFSHAGQEYFLPEDNLVKESIIAFSFADEYFQKFIDTKDPAYLDKVVACIAREKGSEAYPALQAPEGDIREHFSTSRTQARAKAFDTLPTEIKTAIMIFFMGSKQYIHRKYEILFTKKTDTVEEKKGFGRKKIPKPEYGWLGVIYDLAEQKTFGAFDQVKHQFLHTCCYYLTKKKYEQEEQTK